MVRLETEAIVFTIVKAAAATKRMSGDGMFRLISVLTTCALCVASANAQFENVGRCLTNQDISLISPPADVEYFAVHPEDMWSPYAAVWRAKCPDNRTVALLHVKGALPDTDYSFFFNGFAKVEQNGIEYSSSFLQVFQRPEDGAPVIALPGTEVTVAVLPGNYEEQDDGWHGPVFETFDYGREFKINDLFSRDNTLVVPADDESPVSEPALNRSMAGHFFHAPEPGYGIELHQYENRVFIVWYGYDHAGAPIWWFADGNFSGLSVQADLFRQMLVEREDDGNDLERDVVGQISIEFESCNKAKLSFSLEHDAQENLPLVRLLPRKPRCSLFYTE